MIISTKDFKPFTTFFMLYNFIVFWTLRFTIVDKTVKSVSIFLAYGIVILCGLITGLVYIMVRAYFISRDEKMIMQGSKYFKKYDCNLFIGYDVPFILRLRKNMYLLYINQLLLFSNQYSSSKEEYILKIRSGINKMNILDIALICVYKYFSAVLMSIMFFVIWHSSEIIKMKNLLNEAVVVIGLAVLLILAYFKVIEIIKIKIKNILIKRNLDFFIS